MPLKVDNRPPNQLRHGKDASRGGADEVLSDLDDSLDASHARMRYALAVQTKRIELAAQKGGLTTYEIDQLAQLSNSWRVLVTYQPPPDLSEMTTEQIEAQLSAVKARGK